MAGEKWVYTFAAAQALQDDGQIFSCDLTHNGKDRKIYRIGAEVFCVERIWPPVTFADKLGRLVGLDGGPQRRHRGHRPAVADRQRTPRRHPVRPRAAGRPGSG